jgi:hypothetical protein
MMLEGVQVGYPPFLVLAVCLTCRFDLEDRLEASGCNQKKVVRCSCAADVTLHTNRSHP